MFANPSIFAQRLAMHRRQPRSEHLTSPSGGGEFGNNSPGGGFIYPWWYSYLYPYFGSVPFYGQRMFDGLYFWVWTGFSWVPYPGP